MMQYYVQIFYIVIRVYFSSLNILLCKLYIVVNREDDISSLVLFDPFRDSLEGDRSIHNLARKLLHRFYI